MALRVGQRDEGDTGRVAEVESGRGLGYLRPDGVAVVPIATTVSPVAWERVSRFTRRAHPVDRW